MLYREYVWRIKAELKEGIHSTVTKENE